tara:strand:+ start:1287 stop:1688 length:402 start_codon:yes stop_codon:yes gene_type:complete
MLVHVLLYDHGTDNEGIHSLEIKDKTVVLMFEEEDDAQRYCGLLEAQDFPSPSVERVESDEIELFCSQSGYEARLVEKGFIPKSQEDRLLISPPESNLDVTNWNKDELTDNKRLDESKTDDLEVFRNNLENLL